MSPNTTFGQAGVPRHVSRALTPDVVASEGRVCPRCKGIGFVYPEMPATDPDYGRAVQCACVNQELAEQRLARLQRYSNLGNLLHWTFDSLVPHGRSGDPANQEQFQRAVAAAREFARAPQGWFVLTGSSGSGKTHLAAAIANEVIRQGQPALFMIVPDLLDHLRSTFSPTREESYDELFDQVRNAPILLLDDLGSQSSTPWAEEKLYQLLSHRYNAQLPTVVTVGVSMETLDERWRTRLCDPAVSQVWVLEERSDILFQYKGILDLQLLKGMTFRNFDPKGMNATPEQQHNLRVAYQSAMNFAEHPEGWLVLMGQVGCGKTHLAASIANYRVEKGQQVFFVVMADLLDHLRSTFAPDSHVNYDVLFDHIKNAELLILDDLGAHSTSPWAQEKLFQILNHRYNGRFPTVMTTSLAPTELPSAALASRIGDPSVSLPIVIDAPDYRPSEGGRGREQKTAPRSRHGRR